MSAIGVSRPRPDARAKATGATRYAADVSPPGLLHARLVQSPEPHALITGIESSAALQVAGVVAVLSAADLPIVAAGVGRHYEPLAHEEVIFAGQPVALVVAESEAAAQDGAEAVAVEYAPLAPVLGLEAASTPGSPRARRPPAKAEGAGMESIHAAAGGGEEETSEEELSENVVGTVSYREGDAAGALRASDVVVEGSFETSWVYQAYIEPQTATAWLEPDGELVVSTSTQGTFFTRDELAKLFGLELDRVRIRAAPLGGAFGGKFLLVEPLVAAAALRLRRPVRLTFTRSEDFSAGNPAPAELIELRVGASRSGELTALEARLLCDRGTNEEWGVEGISSLLVAGPYRWPAFSIRGYGVLTNRVALGAYRAPGAPPAAFALESLLDELAARLGLDPLELRLRNAVSAGDLGLDGKPFPVIGARECLQAARSHPLWGRRGELPPDEGIGVALGYWPGGNEPSAAACRLDSDGRLTVVTGAVDMSGTDSAFTLIAAEAFGLPPERVRVVYADTAVAPYAGASGGSKVTYTIGRAVQRAAEQARAALLEVASQELEIASDDLAIADGEVRPVGAPARGVPIAELARKAIAWEGTYEPIEGHGGAAQTSLAPSAAAHLAHVRVDRETGRVRLLGLVVVQDVGRALNPALVEGQMRGGAAQGVGWALHEELAYDEYGQLASGSFLDYAVPSAEDLPPIDTVIVEVPAPDGPFGAKGIGEASVIAVAPAVANAINAATGARVRQLPITPPRLWRALQATEDAIES